MAGLELVAEIKIGGEQSESVAVDEAASHLADAPTMTIGADSVVGQRLSATSVSSTNSLDV